MKRFTFMLLAGGLLLVAGIYVFTSSNRTATKNPPERSSRFLLKHSPGFDHPEKFAEIHRRLRIKDGENRSAYLPNYRTTALEKALARSRSNPNRAATFTERGPANVPGRTRAILVDPDDPSQRTWLAASVGGGVWKTTNAGESWTHLTEGLPNLTVSCMAQGVSNPDVIYAGTGEQGIGGSGGNGDGIYKSINRGNSWELLLNTASNPIFQNVNRIIVDPNDPNIVLAAVSADSPDYGAQPTQSAIYRSTNGGANWEEVYQSNFRIQQILANPQDFQVQYASINRKGVIKSTDGGQTWEDVSRGLGSRVVFFENDILSEYSRLELAISTNNPEVLYLSAYTPGSALSGTVFATENGGENWHLVKEADPNTNYDLLGGQGWYDNAIGIHPIYDSVVYVGGVSLWQLQIQPDRDVIADTITDVVYENTASFLRGGVVRFPQTTTLSRNEYVTIELRFGPGRSQKIHRFNGVNGYEALSTVPFEAWDVENNVQLALSFVDFSGNNEFDFQYDFESESEPIFIHLLPYTETQNAEVAQEEGLTVSTLFQMRLVLDGDEVDVDNLPTSQVRVEYGDMVEWLRNTRVMVSYGAVFGPDRVKNSQVNHPDQHTIVPVYTGNGTAFQLLLGNDGGVFLSGNNENPGFANGDWRTAGNTYNTGQFYGADKRIGFQHYVGGTQDNGSWAFMGQALRDSAAQADMSSDYFAVGGGDGFEAVWHKTRPDLLLVSSQFNFLSRVDLAAGTSESATNGLGDSGSGGPFVSRLANEAIDPDLVFAVGRSGVWRSEDFGLSWNLSPVESNWSFGGVPDVAVSGADPRIVWAGYAMSGAADIFVSTDGGFAFLPTQKFEEIGEITGIYTHPTDPNTAYVLFGVADEPKILESRDLGQTWKDISGFSGGGSTDFPDVPVFSFLVMPHEPTTYWAGTEIGLFESVDSGETWEIIDEFPKTLVWDMKVVDDEVVIATHGRGIWTATIPELLTAPQPTATLGPVIESFAQRLSTARQAQVTYRRRALYDSTQVWINGELQARMGQNASPDTMAFTFPILLGEAYTARIVSYKEGEMFRSADKTLAPDNQIVFLPARNFYQTGFENIDHFASIGFEVRSETGFTGRALHTDHPYLSGNQASDGFIDYTAILRIPIVVAANQSEIRYKDVALVEKGEPGSAFGDADFWDYVIVEASRDLVNWVALSPGYDADTDEGWSSTYDIAGRGNESLFVDQVWDLRPAFAPGDTVAVRFRLFSDPFATGWGWVIDDLDIQGASVSNESAIRGELNLYPNPTRGLIHYDLGSRWSRDLSIFVFDTQGRMVWKGKGNPQGSLDLRGQSPGVYYVEMTDGNRRSVEKLIIH